MARKSLKEQKASDTKKRKQELKRRRYDAVHQENSSARNKSYSSEDSMQSPVMKKVIDQDEDKSAVTPEVSMPPAVDDSFQTKCLKKSRGRPKKDGQLKSNTGRTLGSSNKVKSLPVIECRRRSARIFATQWTKEAGIRAIRKRNFVLRHLKRLKGKCNEKEQDYHNGKGCAAILVNHKVESYITAPMSSICKKCGSKLLLSEVPNVEKLNTKCCANGGVQTEEMRALYEELQNPPVELHDVFRGSHPFSREIMNKCQMYNSQLQFGSLFCHSETLPTPGPQVCRLNGEFFFEVSDLKVPDGQSPKFGQLYTLDHGTAMEARLNSEIGSKCQAQVLEHLVRIMDQYNPYAGAYKKAGEVIANLNLAQLENFKMTILDEREVPADQVDERIHAQATQAIQASRQIKMKLSHLYGLLMKAMILRIWMAYGYLLHSAKKVPQGFSHEGTPETFEDFSCKPEAAFDSCSEENDVDDKSVCRKNEFISERQYLRYLLQICGEKKWHWMWNKRGLAELYLFFAETRIERRAMDFYKKQVHTDMRTDLPEEVVNAIKKGLKKGETLGKVYFAPKTWKGSRRYMQKAYADAMAMARKHGNPAWFIIFTGNPAWPEIQRELRENEYPHHRPDVVCRIFVDKAKEFLKDITQRHVMGKVKAWCYSLEHQKRSMPHLHILLTLDESENDGLGTADFVNDYICAEIPCLAENKEDTAPEAIQARELYHIISKHNMHDCSDKSGCLVDGVCNKKFPKPFSDQTVLSGYQKNYRRRAPKQEKLPEDAEEVEAKKYLPKYDPKEFEPSEEDSFDVEDHDPDDSSDEEVSSMNGQKSTAKENDIQQEMIRNELKEALLHEVVPHPDDINPDNDDENQVQYSRRPPIPQSGIPNNDVDQSYGNVFKKKLIRHRNLNGVEKKAGTVILLDNSRVVPHNPFLSLKYGCHINVEYVYGEKCCKYVFKYLMKGNDMAYVRLQKERCLKKSEKKGCAAKDVDYDPSSVPEKDEDTECEDVVDYDKIEHIFKARYMTAQEAWMRLFSQPIVRMSHTVCTLMVHGPAGLPVVFQEGYEAEAALAIERKEFKKESQLLKFFELCRKNPHVAEEQKLLYEELPELYSWTGKEWKKRIRVRKIVSRMYSVSAKNAELFAIRLLLQVKKWPQGYSDLKTINGVEMTSFVHAAVAMNLMSNDKIWKKSLIEVSVEMSVRHFIKYFAMLLCHSNPSNKRALYEDNAIFDLLSPNVFAKMVDREQQVLRRLEYYFLQYNTCSKEQGLPEPKNFDLLAMEKEDEAEQDQINHMGDFGDEKRKKFSWENVAEENEKKMNEEQKRAYDKVLSALNLEGSNGSEEQNNSHSGKQDENKQKLFFLTGDGGTGKSFVYNTLIAKMKAHNRKVIATASTGIAAILLPGGSTTHSAFRIERNLYQGIPVKIRYQDMVATRIRECDMIFIDEISMLRKDTFLHVDKTLRYMFKENDPRRHQPFAGKVVVIGGDWKQLLPVVPGQTIAGQSGESVKNCDLFRYFETLRLLRNMRIKEAELEFANFLRAVGNGLIGSKKEWGEIKLPPSMVVESVDKLIEFCFPKDALKSPVARCSELRDSAILTPTNGAVNDLNNIILKQLPGEEIVYKCIDSTIRDGALDGLSVHVSDCFMENIHNQTPDGMPPHILALKPGAIVMLVKNLSIRDGLSNGTRLQVLKCGENLIECKILTGAIAHRKSGKDKKEDGSIVQIPMVKFQYRGDETQPGVSWKRVQFPLKLSFAMTINKAQGQTLDRVALALYAQDLFSHGPLYTGFSRVRTMSSIKVLCKNKGNVIKNVVHEPMLDEADYNDPVLKEYVKAYQLYQLRKDIAQKRSMTQS